MSDRAVTANLLALLNRHYIKPGQPLPGGIFVTEVGRNGTLNSSRADAIFVGFTSTSGRLMVGHEVKASRADWLRELDQQGKADAWADECHAWYVVAPSTAVVKPEEVPPGWGLLLPGRSRTRMDVAVKADVHRDRQPSWNACRSLFARLDTLRAQTIAEHKADAEQRIREDIEARYRERDLARTAHTTEGRARKHLDELCAVLGMSVESFAYGDDRITPAELGGALARYVHADRDVQRATRDLADRYVGGVDELQRRVEQLRQALGAVQALTAAQQTSTAGAA